MYEGSAFDILKLVPLVLALSGILHHEGLWTFLWMFCTRYQATCRGHLQYFWYWGISGAERLHREPKRAKLGIIEQAQCMPFITGIAHELWVQELLSHVTLKLAKATEHYHHSSSTAWLEVLTNSQGGGRNCVPQASPSCSRRHFQVKHEYQVKKKKKKKNIPSILKNVVCYRKDNPVSMQFLPSPVN